MKKTSKMIAILDVAGAAGEVLCLVREELSLDDRQRQIQDALKNAFGVDAQGWANYYQVETYDDYVIARGPEARLYRIEYAMTEDGAVTFGKKQEVEEVYVPVQESARFVEEAAAGDGWSMPVQIIEAGAAFGSLNEEAISHYYTPKVVGEFAAAADGARFGRRHPGPLENPQDPGRIAGYFTEGKVVGNAARATLHILKTEVEIKERLAAAREAGRPDLFNLSVLALVAFKPGVIEGKQVLVSEKLVRLVSIDLVAEAGAGGKFLSPMRVAAGADLAHEISRLQSAAIKSSSGDPGEKNGTAHAGRKEGAQMKNRIKKVLEALRKHDAGRATELDTKFNTLPEDKHSEFLVEVTEAYATAIEAAETAAAGTPPAAPAQAAQPATATAVAEAQNLLTEAKKIQSANLIDRKLADSKLQAPWQKLVREHLADRVVTEAEVDTEITRVREAAAASNGAGRINAGAPVMVGLDSADKVQLAVEGMLGVKESLNKGVVPFRSIQQAYKFITGDTDLSFGRNGRGGFTAVSEAIATSDFANLLSTSMTKRAIQDYKELGMGGLDRLISRSSVADYKTQDRVRDGYFGDLASVNEAAAYQEITKPTDEKISYAVGKYGNLLTISEETIRNDDLSKIVRFPQKVARAGRRTLKQFITNFFVNNPNYDVDSVAVFHANHSNLGSDALNVDALIAAEITLMKQQEKDSNKRLGLRLSWLMVPVDLAATAWKINNSEFYQPGPGVKEPNPFYKRFGQNGEAIIVNELLTDVNDWYCGADPADIPFLEIGFLDGIEEPQIFVANDPNAGGLAFTNDQVVYKVKMVFGGDVIDFRPVRKHVVA